MLQKKRPPTIRGGIIGTVIGGMTGFVMSILLAIPLVVVDGLLNMLLLWVDAPATTEYAKTALGIMAGFTLTGGILGGGLGVLIGALYQGGRGARSAIRPSSMVAAQEAETTRQPIIASGLVAGLLGFIAGTMTCAGTTTLMVVGPSESTLLFLLAMVSGPLVGVGLFIYLRRA